MISSKSLKILLFFTFVFFSSCKFWQNSSNSNSNTESNNAPEIISEIPFSTKEPENYQAEMVEKLEDNEETKIFIARSGQRFFVRNNNFATLRIDANNSLSVNFNQKIYAEIQTKTSASKENSGETLQDFLTTEWLNQKTEGKFENLGDENGLTKYRVKFEASEALIFVNENFKLPVRQEFYSLEGEEKILRMTIELQNLKLQADESLFEIPKDFRKVSIEEFRQSLKGND